MRRMTQLRLMKNFLIILSIGLCVTVAAIPHTGISNDPATNNDYDDEFKLDPDQSKIKTCKTIDKREGICVSEGTCSEALNIEVNGIIDESELRIGTCSGEDWCCVHPNMSLFTNVLQISTPLPTPLPMRGCRTGLKDACPWCAALYRNNPRTNAPQLFCGGAVVGSRFVLTTASCAIAHRQTDLWMQLPGNTRQYLVNTTVNHMQFSSATREHDVALLLLNEDVEWSEGPQEDLGACLGLRTPLVGDCVAIGFDGSGRLTFTPLTVTAKSCSQYGATQDSACGRAASVAACSVASGSPVLCPYGSNDLIIAGLVRQTCQKDSTLLGSLMASADWLSEKLSNLTLAANFYTISQ